MPWADSSPLYATKFALFAKDTAQGIADLAQRRICLNGGNNQGHEILTPCCTCAGYLAYAFQRKSTHDGSTSAFSLQSTNQISGFQVSCIPMYFLILEQILLSSKHIGIGVLSSFYQGLCALVLPKKKKGCDAY
jgi:hypothetical protein